MKRFAFLLLLACVLTAGCSKSHKSPTAPAPDNPNPPVVTCTPDWLSNPATVQLTAVEEDLVVNFLWVSASGSSGGGVQLDTDLAGGTTLHKGVALTAHITVIDGTSTPYVWHSGDQHVVRLTVHRPGQSTNFPLYLIRE